MHKERPRFNGNLPGFIRDSASRLMTDTQSVNERAAVAGVFIGLSFGLWRYLGVNEFLAALLLLNGSRIAHNGLKMELERKKYENYRKQILQENK